MSAALWTAGCQSSTNAESSSGQDASADAATTSGVSTHKNTSNSTQAEAGVSPPANLPTPPGVDRLRLLARQGELLKRAKLPLAEILASLPESAKVVLPADMSPAAAGDAKANDDKQAVQNADVATPEIAPEISDDLPRAAQIAYVTGRIALTEGKMQAAILQLKIALGIAPNEPDIARLLATAYLRIGNRPAAAMYLQQALRSDPQDIDSMIKLGRASLERGDWPEAVVLFARSLEIAKQTEPQSPSLEQICEFNLGSALEVGGYDKTSAQMYLASMDGSSQLTDSTAARYQMMLLSRQSGVVWQAVGDAMLRLGKPADAVEAYNKAVAAGVPSLSDWMARYVYTQLLLGRPSQATKRMVEYLKSPQQNNNTSLNNSTLKLVTYLLEHGGDSRPLAQILRQTYAESDKSSAMAQMIGSLLPDDQAKIFLLEHLKDRPTDLDVADALIKRVMHVVSQPASKTDAMLDRAVQGLDVTCKLIEQSAPQAADYARQYLDALGDNTALEDVVAKFAVPSQSLKTSTLSSVRFLTAADHLRRGNLRTARPILEAIAKDDPSFMPARLVLANQLAARARWDEASELLVGIEHEPWLTQADNLRVKILSGQGKTDDALALLDKLIAQEPGDVDLTMYKAGLQVQSGKVVQGERTLLDLLNVHPRNERIYKTLFDLYDRGDVPDVSTQYQRLMIRLFETIPQSRIARLQQVEMLIVRRENDQAEKILRDLITNDDKDFESLGILTRLLHDTDRSQEANALIEEKLAKMGDDIRMLQFAAEYYQAFKNLEKSYDMRERLAKQLDDPSQRAMNLAVLYMQQDKLEQARTQAELAQTAEAQDPQAVVSVMLHVLSKIADATPEADRAKVIQDAKAQVDKASKQYPEFEADIGYELASFYARLGDEQASLDEMARTLEKFPKHASSNNGLGYSWADKGIHLEKAREMIQIAVDAQPHNIAYLDSLGWVYYKLGKFDKAIFWLSQAATGGGRPSPVILDHLGDAFYRNGNVPKAIQIWRQAQRLLEVGDFSQDPEAARLPQALKDKVDAASRKEDAVVAPLPAEALSP